MIRKGQARLLLAFAILLTVTAIVVATNGKSTISGRQGDFAVSDTSAVTVVLIADAQGGSVELHRSAGQWLVDGQTPARADMVQVLIKVLHDIDKSKVVARSDARRIVSEMKKSGTKLTVRNRKKTLVTYHLLFEGDVCYAMLERASRPFAVEVPGYGQMISILHLTDPTDWKSRSVFAVNSHDIRQIVFDDNTDGSFVVRQSGRGFEVLSHPLGLKVPNVDEEKLFRYVAQFRYKEFSAYVQMQPFSIDSIKATTPMYTLSVTTADGHEFWCKAYERHLSWKHGEKDFDNFYLLLGNGDFVQAKYFDFDPIVKNLDYFRAE